MNKTGAIYTLPDRRYVARQMGRDKTNCIICDEKIQLTDGEFVFVLNGNPIFKVCDKCKQAVIEVRKKLEKKQQRKITSAPNNICAMH